MSTVGFMEVSGEEVLWYRAHFVLTSHHPSTHSIGAGVVCFNAASVVVTLGASHHQFQAPLPAPADSPSLSTR